MKPCSCRAISTLITAEKLNTQRRCVTCFCESQQSHHRRVKNASSYKPTWFCGTELYVSLETQKMFVLKAKMQNFK